MAGPTKIVVAVLLGILIGLIFTIHTLDEASWGAAVGPWQSTPRDEPGIDPYRLAAIARDSLLPLSSTEGLTFVATSDSQGRGFSPTCDYVVGGTMPEARYWTLTLLTPRGFPVANPAERSSFTSAEALRMADQPVAITVAPEAHSGNWLPTGHSRSYVLMLRLYDTGLSTVGTTIEAAAMPTIQRMSCR